MLYIILQSELSVLKFMAMILHCILFHYKW